MLDRPNNLDRGFLNEQQRLQLEASLRQIEIAQNEERAAHAKTMAALSETRNLLTHLLQSETPLSAYERMKFKVWDTLTRMRTQQTRYGNGTEWEIMVQNCYQNAACQAFVGFLDELVAHACSETVLQKIPEQLALINAPNVHYSRLFGEVTFDIRNAMQGMTEALQKNRSTQ